MRKHIARLETIPEVLQLILSDRHTKRVPLYMESARRRDFPYFGVNFLACLFQHEFCQKVDLLLLFIDEGFQLDRAHPIELIVQRHDFDLRLQIDLVVVCGVDPILGRMAVLAHHDHRRLNRCEHG